MQTFLSFFLSKQKAVLFLFGFILLAGTLSFLSIPKESTPDIKIPYIYVGVTYEGISAKDAEDLLLKPLEQNLKNIQGIKKINATAYEGGVNAIVEFQAGQDLDRALQDVRVNVDKAKADFPEGTKEPFVEETNISLFPILLVELSGSVSERVLYRVAESLETAIKSRVSSVLKAPVQGTRQEVVEILLDPYKVDLYGLLSLDVFDRFSKNSSLINAGNLSMGTSEFSIRVPGIFKDIQDIINMPLITDGDTSIRVGDVAEGHSTYKDSTVLVRERGMPTVTLEISKRLGHNIIETTEAVRRVVAEEQKTWPLGIKVTFVQDESHHIRDMLKDLRSELTSAVILVMIVIMATLGWRSSLLVGLAVPGSFLMAILVLALLGYTLNTVVLFSLILSVGMLVDGAIVVVEYADRKLLEGMHPAKAYLEGAIRMAWPVISSIITIILAFLPLLFWPGIMGEFMKFLPITLIATLSASLLMALIFIPTLGALFGKGSSSIGGHKSEAILQSETGNVLQIPGWTGKYVHFLNRCLDKPLRPLLGAMGILAGVIVLYSFLSKGVEFFPNIEPETAQIVIHGRGNLSIEEKDTLVRQVEERILPFKNLLSIYTRVGKNEGNGDQDGSPQDTIGSIRVEFTDWQHRPKGHLILEELEKAVQGIPGIKVEVQKDRAGPSQGKPIQVEVKSVDPDMLLKGLSQIRSAFEAIPGLVGIEDDTPLPGIEWEMVVDRDKAAKYGADIQSAGNAVQLLTQGYKVGAYKPETAKEEIDIVVRFPQKYRNLDTLKRLHISTQNGLIPLVNFVSIQPKPRLTNILRVDAQRIYTIKADTASGALVDDKVKELKEKIAALKLPEGVSFEFKGEEEDKQETSIFLMKAFGTAVFLIALILLLQFNSFFSVGVILSAVFMSTIGVFVGLMIRGMPFGIVMGGIGVIALSGIIVSNNIIFIDTFDRLRASLGVSSFSLVKVQEIILRTGAHRLRPVILTKLTIILGLLPIMLGININYIDREILIDAPSGQWWMPLATTIVFGVLFASPLTLVVTPCFLMVREKFREQKQKKKR